MNHNLVARKGLKTLTELFREATANYPLQTAAAAGSRRASWPIENTPPPSPSRIYTYILKSALRTLSLCSLNEISLSRAHLSKQTRNANYFQHCLIAKKIRQFYAHAGIF